jgi:hypothetical protein
MTMNKMYIKLLEANFLKYLKVTKLPEQNNKTFYFVN